MEVKEASADYLVAASPRVPTGYKQTEVGMIPEDWTLSSLMSLSAFITKGSTPTTYGFKWEQTGVLFLRSECVAENGLDLSQSMFISEAAHASLRRSEVKEGDILVTITGYVGRSVVFKNAGEANINQHIARVRIISPNVSNQFIYYVLAQPSYRVRFNSITTGQAYPQISLKQIRETKIPLPPTKAEQEAIAEALSDANALIESLAQLLAKKRHLKQGAMQQLLTGKKRLPGFSAEWEVKRLGDLAELKNGYAFKSITYTVLGNFNVVTIANVQDGYMDVSECNKIDVLPRDLQPHHGLAIGDLLISMTGNVGRVCLVNTPDCVLNQRVGKLVPSNVDAPFLFLLLSQRQFLTAMAGKAKGGAQGNLSVSDITDFMFPIPANKTEQTAIATILSDMDAELAELEEKLAKARAIKQGMMQELLTGRIRLA